MNFGGILGTKSAIFAIFDQSLAMETPINPKTVDILLSVIIIYVHIVIGDVGRPVEWPNFENRGKYSILSCREASYPFLGGAVRHKLMKLKK